MPDTGEQAKAPQSIRKKKVIHTGRMWVLTNQEAKLVYYHYSPTRATYNAEWLLNGYTGLVISDAYAAYLNIAGNPAIGIILMLCWAHARRRFTDLVEKGKKTDPVVMEVIRRIGELYSIEQKLKDKSDAEIMAARKKSASLLTDLKLFLEEKKKQYTPKEPVTEAINYLLNHWGYFTEYTKHPRGIMDNNYVERSVRPVTINRKNSLFFGAVKGL